MSEREHTGTAVSLTDRQLRYIAAGFAYLVAGLHLFHPDRGFPRLVLQLGAEPTLVLTEPRPLAFVLSGLAILVAIKLVLLGFPRRPVYLLGMALMVTYIVGYFTWHLTGHGGFLPGREPHYHDVHPLHAVVSHLRGDAWARVTKLTETVLLAVLALLYYREFERIE